MSGENEKTLEERIAQLERKQSGLPDLSNMTPEQIAEGRARGTIPHMAAPDALSRSYDFFVDLQRALNADPLTPEEAVARYVDCEPPSICYFPQHVRLTSNLDHRRADFPRGWHLIPPCFVALLSTGYMSVCVVPTELINRVAAWQPSAKTQA